MKAVVPKQLYSQRSIGIATVLGSPLAGSILVRRNYINMGKELHGKYALIIGILFMLAVFGTVFIIPDDIEEKLPNMAFPILYTAIVYVVVEKLQGKELKAHKDRNGVFYSAWKAAGVGFVCLLILLVGIFGYVYSQEPEFDAEAYDRGLAEINKNEAIALKLFEIDVGKGPDPIVEFINTQGVPNWEKNMALLNQMDSIEGLTDEFRNQNELIRGYCQLRIQSYRLIEKASREGTERYMRELEDLNRRINEQIKALQGE